MTVVAGERVGLVVRRRAYSRLTGTMLLLGWLVVAVLGVVLGARETSYAELQRALAAGGVHSVQVSGELPHDATGYGPVVLHWRAGLWEHVAEVLEARPMNQEARKAARDQGLPLRAAGAVERLAAEHQGVQVRRVGGVGAGHLSGELLGWEVPGWLGMAVFVLGVLTLGQLVSGPQPARATKWAWFWLMALVAPLGVPAFLLLGTVLRARPDAKRLAGGWGLLLAVVLGGVARQVW